MVFSVHPRLLVFGSVDPTALTCRSAWAFHWRMWTATYTKTATATDARSSPSFCAANGASPIRIVDHRGPSDGRHPGTSERGGVHVVLVPIERDAAVEAPVISVRRTTEHVHEGSEDLEKRGRDRGEGKGVDGKKASERECHSRRESSNCGRDGACYSGTHCRCPSMW